MSLGMTITVDSMRPGLARLAKLGRDKKPVLRAMGNTFKSITEGNFNSVGAQFRPKEWVPKRDKTPSILQRSTTLVKSFHLEVTDEKATLSNATKYAAIHQFGGVILPKRGKVLRFMINGKWVAVKMVKIPARPFFPVANNALTAPAENLIGRAGARVIAKMQS